MYCKDCGEQMEGDGYTIVLHCPNVDVSDITPDCDPVYCEMFGVDKTLLGDVNERIESYSVRGGGK